MSKPGLPTSLRDNPSLTRWVHFQDDGTVASLPVRVEMGQGVVTAMWQIAAEELDVPLERVRVLSGNTIQVRTNSTRLEPVD